jgi:hypothetical protein
MATKMPANIAIKMATELAVACMSVSCEEFTPSRLGLDIPALSSLKNTINADLGHNPAYPDRNMLNPTDKDVL